MPVMGFDPINLRYVQDAQESFVPMAFVIAAAEIA
jgi:hypothetical protein